MSVAWRWPAIVVGALTLHVLVSLFFVYLATSDPSFAVEEDYYQKALHWDDKRAQDRLNVDLGWALAVDVEPPSTLGTDPMLRVSLADRGGAGIEGARVAVEAFFTARSDRVLRAELDDLGEGVYETRLPMRRSGLWELRFAVEREGRLFTAVEKRHLVVR